MIGNIVFLYILFIAKLTFSAVCISLLNVNIEGPDPDIPPPKAPALMELLITSSNLESILNCVVQLYNPLMNLQISSWSFV